ncbi:Scavenger receptor class B member 1 [Pseudolycoriella hygida]|uniref:Scavenger receptor class B member 1 n=1 Tax=Pseudolycoriella hygida TaxID=35572 RepID=A0A9Q0S6U3_9DIPT|nr:Scavenger receptor class B member 1 [Pseudolycoriella hygida]
MSTMHSSQSSKIKDKDRNKIEFRIHPESKLNGDLDLITTKKGSETNLKRKKKCQCGTVPLMVFGLILLTFGLLSIKFRISDVILDIRLQMIPGTPPFELWLNPQPEVRLNVFIFTVENANEFLNGNEPNIKIKEIGPIVYREYLKHSDVIFHPNSTLSYTATRRAEFLPLANTPGILNETIVVPNFALLAAAGFVNTQNFFIKFGYTFMEKQYNEGLFINISIYDYLWNYKSRVLEKAKALAPTMVPTLNSGILHGIYVENSDRYNVRIGKKYGDSEFFLINTLNGAPTVPGYNVENGDCYASVQNATEGAMYRQRLTKKSVLSFWRKALCRTAQLHYEKEMKIGNIPAYKYILRSNMYDRLPNKERDCYKGTYGELPNGLTDVSKCYFNMPFAASLPHFYGRSEGFTKKFQGLHPDEEKHTCFTIVEPTMGAPLVQTARSQMNLVIPKLSYLFENHYKKFEEMILPLFWIEYYQNGLTPQMESMIGFFVNVLPIIQITLTSTLLIVGFTLTVVAFDLKFVQMVVNKSDRDRTVESYRVEKGVLDGQNFSSNTIRLFVNLHPTDDRTNVKRNYFLKICLKTEDFLKACEECLYYEKEIEVYSKILPTVEESLRSINEPGQLAPKCYYTDLKRGVLVFEDLSDNNFESVSKSDGMDLDHLRLSLSTLAKWHAATAVLLLTRPELFEWNKKTMYKNSKTIEGFFKSIAKTLSNTAKKWSEFEEVADKLINIPSHVYEDIYKEYLPTENGFNVLLHGDMWSNNILFHHNTQGKPTDIRLVDFALCKHTNPSFDLALLLYGSSHSASITQADRETLIKFYHIELNRLLRKLRYPAQIPTLLDIQALVFRFDFYNALIVLFVIGLRYMGESFDGGFVELTKNAQNGEGESATMYSHPKCIEDLKYLLNMFDRRGYFDF